ncbi:MAG: hemerythrin domain-containing protein [Cryomorphaceae bacterium]|nr:MAG: hemerythrin domain-containing protein [Cryomorphaceae bacterium]
MKNKPLNRHTALQPLSRDHHRGLLLCWKIRKGLQHGVSPERIKAYADWFWEHHLHPHFNDEETLVFSLLPSSHPMIQQALNEHLHLRELFGLTTANASVLNHIADDLEQHIRFEERVLFQEIQRVSSEEELASLELHEDENASCPAWKDEFWK